MALMNRANVEPIFSFFFFKLNFKLLVSMHRKLAEMACVDDRNWGEGLRVEGVGRLLGAFTDCVGGVAGAALLQVHTRKSRL